MSIASTDLLFYSSASVPTDDASTTGGAIDATSRVSLTQFGANAVAAVVSDGADTRTITVTGRLASGVVDTEVLTLNGTTEVVGAKTWERILSLVASATSGTRTASIKQGSGGTVIATITPNETKRHIQYQKSTSESGIAVRYEKQFALNNHGSLSLLGANVTLTTDSQAVIQIGLSTTINDTGTVTNRKTAPASVTFVDDNVAQNVVGTDLAPAAKQGVWIQQTLAANAAAAKSTFTLQLAGSSV